jgi:Tol biopolymer transport system component
MMKSTVRAGVLSIAVAAIASPMAIPQAAQPAQSRKALTLENIVGRQGGARQAAISPDGQYAAVSGDGPEGSGIYLAQTTGPATPKLWVQGNGAAWFPDSKRIVFSRGSDLWTVAVGSTDTGQRGRTSARRLA